MLGQKAVGFLCFGCFIIHSIFLVYSNNNQQSVDNSKYQNLVTIPFPLKIQITVEPGIVGISIANYSIIHYQLYYFHLLSGFNLSHLDTEGFGGIWDFFFSNHQEAVKIFREKNITGRYLPV